MRALLPLVAGLPGCLLLAEPPSSVSGVLRPGDGLDDVAVAAVRVSAGWDTACALYADGRARCAWAEGSVPSPAPAVELVDLAVNGHACGVGADGLAICWGMGSNSPMAGAAPPAEAVISVRPGVDDTCALRAADGGITCWGGGASGETSPPAGAFAVLAMGRDDGCAIDTVGALRCWGAGLGEPPAGAFVDVAVGFDSACAVQQDGQLACWGAPVEAPGGGGFVAVSGTYLHFCALDADGRAACFGADTAGETAAPDAPLREVSAGWGMSCGIGAEDGRVTCWGDADLGG